MARLPGMEGTDEIAARIRARRGGTLHPLDEMLLHSPQLADGWNSFLGAVRRRMSLPDMIRELVILRIAVLNRADYEWAAHEPDARRAGLNDAQLDAVKRMAVPISGSASGPLRDSVSDSVSDSVFSEVQRLAIAYADAVTIDVHVSDEVFDALRPHFTEKELVELTATVAAYNMVSRFLVALQVGSPAATRMAR
ncbi:carboxymuconolactone decarboxylase family protein [Nonomuraea sp. NEAU-A123]|uniref:carboxymuconolactone decarboxylase family protein n=1 Tax=Nonomuraea sp. NEAU-A123 TaxID=2839649 RepID=UPI001BE3F17A|nr:carboxymuconolactone decarboxylase family protein [Nonomuraea sp. NEAU-A123]MBT2225731.1 carboxymuconolactone decarboxylase family protein [Nonomuraea sp. NEAU-A123]